jgi:DNA-binding transcriptional LysR family regulator
VENHERIGRRLKLRDLHVLLEVARRGSMAKAAAALAMSQPAVTKVIADMERTLSVRLLDRKPQGVEPTIFGRALLKWSDVVFEDIRDALREIRSLADPSVGEVWIGGSEPMVEGILPVAIGQLSARYPNIVHNVTMAPNAAHRLDELRARKLDLIVGRLPRHSLPDEFVVERLFDDPMVVVSARQSPWARKRKLRLAALADEPWVLPRPDTTIGAFVQEAFKSAGAHIPQRGAVCGSLHFSYMLIATGRYLGLFPKSLIHYSGSRFPVRALPVELPIAPPPVGIVTLRNRSPHPATALFIERLRLLARPLAEAK